MTRVVKSDIHLKSSLWERLSSRDSFRVNNLSSQLLSQPLSDDLLQLFLMVAETVVSSPYLSHRYLVITRTTILKVIGHARVCQAIGKTVNYENGSGEQGDVCRRVGTSSRPPQTYYMVRCVECLAQWAEINEHPGVPLACGLQFLGPAENFACRVQAECSYVPLEEISRRSG